MAAWIARPETIVRIGFFLIAALYARTLAFDFVYDDYSIPVSPLIQSWHGVIDAFKLDVFGSSAEAGSSYYRPLSSAFTVIVVRLTGGAPGWLHLASLLLALVAFLLAYQLGRVLFDDDLLAALTAILFALHPTKVETIAWIGSGTCDGQAEIYCFALLICYLRWWRSRKPLWMAASAGFFCAALFTKETTIVFPALVALHAWLLSPRGKRSSTAVALMFPYALMLGAYELARHAVLRPLPNASVAIQPIFTLVNVWSAPLAFWWYVRRLLYPSGLSILYDLLIVHTPTLWNFWLPAVCILALLAATFLAWRRARSWRIPFFVAWLLLTLGPPLALSPRVTLHDRYLQIAAFPFCALLAYAILCLARDRQWRLVAVCALVAVLGAWSLSTWHESGYWRDSLSLWGRAVEIAPHNINARLELARLEVEHHPDQAVHELDEGLRYVPDSPGLWRMRGLLLFNAGDYEAAQSSLLKTLALSERYAEPQPADVKFGRATAAFYLGQIEIVRGDLPAADRWLRMALEIAPDNAAYQRVMIDNLRKRGLDAEAQQRQRMVDESFAHSGAAIAR